MKFKVMVVIVALVLALILVPISSACSSSAPQTIELTYSTFFGPTHLNAVMSRLWIKEVESRSNGKVHITFYPGEQLNKAPQMYDGVTTGVSDIAMSVLAYSMGKFPSSELVDLPHGYPNGWVATKVANDYYNQFKPAEFDNVHVLYLHAHGPGVLVTCKKPVRTLEDMSGMVIRSTGVGAKIMQALGATAKGATQGEVADMMQKGAVDGSFTTRESLKAWNQAPFVNYVTMTTDLGYSTDFFIVMNKDKWNSLPADVQKVFTDVSQEWIEKQGMVWDYLDKDAMDYFQTLPGREVITLPPAEVKKWADAAVQPLIDDYIKQKTETNKLPAADYQNYILERVSYWSAKSPTLDASVDWVTKNVLPAVPAPSPK